MDPFSLESARELGREGRAEDWIHMFLLGPGNNNALSDGLKKAPRYWIGPVEIPLDRLYRCCGPEAGMEYPEDVELWAKRLQDLSSFLRSGRTVPPLIAEYRSGRLNVRDGGHRLGAFESLGCEKAWTFIWHNSQPEFERHWAELSAEGTL